MKGWMNISIHTGIVLSQNIDNMTDFFKPNWYRINQAIENSDLTELRRQQKELSAKIQKKIDHAYEVKRQQVFTDKLAALKDLAPGSEVFVMNAYPNCNITFGNLGYKVKDGKTRMSVEVNGKKWLIYYKELSIVPPSEEQLISFKVKGRIIGLLHS